MSEPQLFIPNTLYVSIDGARKEISFPPDATPEQLNTILRDNNIAVVHFMTEDEQKAEELEKEQQALEEVANWRAWFQKLTSEYAAVYDYARSRKSWAVYLRKNPRPQPQAAIEEASDWDSWMQTLVWGAEGVSRRVRGPSAYINWVELEERLPWPRARLAEYDEC